MGELDFNGRMRHFWAAGQVNLLAFKDRWAGKFSGGMKRRLSVAISLMGSPPVVYLDEPSTGLDPASRRQLWDVISRAKGDKSIVLTTHSMEEASPAASRERSLPRRPTRLQPAPACTSLSAQAPQERSEDARGLR